MHISRSSLTTAALASAVLLAPTVAFSIDFNECGSFECDGNGCLIFRADDGTRYALIVPGGSYTPKYTPGNRGCITGNSGCRATCNGVVGCVTETNRSISHRPRRNPTITCVQFGGVCSSGMRLAGTLVGQL